MAIAVTYERERETKNKVRYEPAAGEPVVGSLYLDKGAAAELGEPVRLSVSIEPAETESQPLAA